MQTYDDEVRETQLEIQGKLLSRRLLWTDSQLKTTNILKQMVEQGAIPSSQHASNAIKNNNLMTLRLLIDNGVPIDETHLTQAIMSNSIGIVKETLKHISFDKINDEHLSEAIAVGNLKVIAILTEQITPNYQHLAASTGKVKKLLRAAF